MYQSLFTFTRIPPKHAVAETIALVLQAMLIEEMPQRYLEELRELAARPDAQLLPLSRIMLVGTVAGEQLSVGTPTQFRPGVVLTPPPAPVPAPRTPAIPKPPAVPTAAAAQAARDDYFGFSEEPELPPVIPPPATAGAKVPRPPLPSAVPPVPAQPPAAPFGTPFAVPGDEVPFGGEGLSEGGFGWSWEPPEEGPPG